MRFFFDPAPAVVAAALGACTLIACSGVDVGTGEKPTQLTVGVTATQASAQISECTTLALNAYVAFTGDKGDSSATFTTRVKWASQDPSIVFVSDGVALSPAGKLYPAGTIIGLRPGLATVTANYLDFNTAIAVDVSSLDDLHIDTSLLQNNVEVTDVGTLLTQPYLLKAIPAQGQPEANFTTQALWRFDPATNNAFVDQTTGLVHATKSTDGAQLKLVARLPECDREVTKNLRVSPVKQVGLVYERGPSDTPLPIGFSEAFTVKASFDASLTDPVATQQDVTTQTELESIDSDYIAAVLGADAWYVTAAARVGSGSLQLRFTGVDGFPFLTSKNWLVQNTELTSLTLGPENLQITFPDTGQLVATGTFDNGLVIPITRAVTWTSSEPKQVTISSAADTAGVVTVTNIAGDAQVTASFTVDGVVLDDVVTVHAFANPFAD